MNYSNSAFAPKAGRSQFTDRRIASERSGSNVIFVGTAGLKLVIVEGLETGGACRCDLGEVAAMNEEEYFGDPGKVALMRRSAALYQLLRDDPRFAYYGRVVTLSGTCKDTLAAIKALARLQGAGVCYYFPKADADQLYAKLESAGFKTDRHEHYWGGEQAFQASLHVLENAHLPDDLTIQQLDDGTPAGLVRDVAELLQSCDVMPVPGSFLRGRARPGLTLVAVDRSGKPVASASSFVLHHPDSERANDVFWGMLATREDRRGEKIALQLGAMAIRHMWLNEGARGFITGVRHDNRSSQALCNKLGVYESDWIYAQCLDEAVLGSSSVTK